MAPTRGSADTRQTLLHTACEIVLREGASHLTLDAVAKAAGVSKGGLLYHFPSKEALISGMIALLVEQFSTSMDTEHEPEAPGAWSRAYIRASLDTNQLHNDLSASLFAAVATNPDLLEPLRTHYAAWQQSAEHDGIDPALATVVRLAVDGLWLAELLGLAPPVGPLREQVAATLLALTHKELL